MMMVKLTTMSFLGYTRPIAVEICSYWKYDRFDSVAMKDLYEDLIENSHIVTQLLEKCMHNDIKLY